MAIRVYKSTDAGAPVLTNAVNSLIPVLDCLVSGLGPTPGAGWTKPFTGTNKAVYKQGAGSNGFHLRVDDSTATLARAVAYESMTTVDAGTNAFPTELQFPGGLYMPKSASASACSWVLVASEKYFILNVNQANEATFSTAQPVFFGDFISRKPGDAFNTIFIGGGTAGVSTTAQFQTLSTTLGVVTGHYLARPHTQVGQSTQCAKVVNNSLGVAIIGGGGSPNLTYPSPITGGIELGRILVTEGTAIRGHLDGVMAPLHNKPLTHGDTFTPTSGDFVGKSFMAMNINGPGQVLVEI
jgi:hypothetical protein